MMDRIDAYIATLRNDSKRGYAYAYSRWLLNEIVTIKKGQIPAPQPSNLSAINALAVKMHIHQIATEYLGRPF